MRNYACHSFVDTFYESAFIWRQCAQSSDVCHLPNCMLFLITLVQYQNQEISYLHQLTNQHTQTFCILNKLQYRPTIHTLLFTNCNYQHAPPPIVWWLKNDIIPVVASIICLDGVESSKHPPTSCPYQIPAQPSIAPPKHNHTRCVPLPTHLTSNTTQ
jgi:hypothetical protein